MVRESAPCRPRGDSTQWRTRKAGRENPEGSHSAGVGQLQPTRGAPAGVFGNADLGTPALFECK